MGRRLHEAHLPCPAGAVVRRSKYANAYSLNEPGSEQMLWRALSRPEKLTKIIDWLAVDEPTHVRYCPRNELYFCNIYAHDVCALSGSYLPRVWWTASALASWSQAGKPEELYEQTVEEMTANALFHWMQQYGLMFDWVRVADLTELQRLANSGAACLILGYGSESEGQGHISVIVPETPTCPARRSGSGEVETPVQSQAGANLYRRSTEMGRWWLKDEIASYGYWACRTHAPSS